MSNRRKGFDTGLSSSASASSKPNGNRSVTSQPTPPAIHAPKAAEPTATVPTDSGPAAGAVTDFTQEELDDISTCFICAEPITLWSTGICGHKTCQYVHLVGVY
jgi:hypothetical protein